MSPLTASPLTIELSLLGLLRQQPMHGYDLYKQLNHLAGISLVWRIKQSQLYALLDKLETKGYLTSVVDQTEPLRPRKVYHLTEAGKMTFLEWVSSPVKHGREMRMEFLAKLYFARIEGKETLHKLVSEQNARTKEWLQIQRDHLANTNDGTFEALVCQFRIHQIEAYLNWLGLCVNPVAIQEAYPANHPEDTQSSKRK
jgi:DNA-binding PadR family transcriptional regulator